MVRVFLVLPLFLRANCEVDDPKAFRNLRASLGLLSQWFGEPNAGCQFKCIQKGTKSHRMRRQIVRLRCPTQCLAMRQALSDISVIRPIFCRASQFHPTWLNQELGARPIEGFQSA
jgi:hypothetical protein